MSVVTKEERVHTISHYICGAMNCKCEGVDSDWGADPKKALCFNIARKLIALSDIDRMEIIEAILPQDQLKI